MEVKVSAGNILIAQPFMDDDNFKRTVIGITDHGKEGSVGLIQNKVIKVKLSELIPTIDAEGDFKVFFGGPVATDTIHYIHNVGHLLDDSIKVKNNIYWGGDFEKLVALINNGLITDKNIRFYIGYSGWSVGQLEAELESGSWIVSNWDANYTFQSEDNQLWEQALGHKGDSYSIIAKIPNSPNKN